jgi:hypothetical protein
MRVSQSQDWIPSSEGMTEEARNHVPRCLPPEHVTLCKGFARRKRGSMWDGLALGKTTVLARLVVETGT